MEQTKKNNIMDVQKNHDSEVPAPKRTTLRGSKRKLGQINYGSAL